MPQRIDHTVDDRGELADGNQVDDDFRVHGRLENTSPFDQPFSQLIGVGQIAVMGNGQTAKFEIGEQRLHVPQHGFARRRVTVVTDGHGAGQAANNFLGVKIIADQSQRAVRVKMFAIGGNHARGFLAPVLQGVKTESGMGGGVLMSEHAEHTAFFVEMIVIKWIGG